MTEETARDILKDIFQLLTSRLREEKGRSREQGIYLWWFQQNTGLNMYLKKSYLGRKKKRVGSLASHLGVLDDDFEEIIAAGKISKVQSWYNNMGLHVQTYRDHSITWIYFDEAFDLSQWEHLPRNQIIWGNTCPAWFFHPACGWVEISNG